MIRTRRSTAVLLLVVFEARKRFVIFYSSIHFFEFHHPLRVVACKQKCAATAVVYED